MQLFFTSFINFLISTFTFERFDTMKTIIYAVFATLCIHSVYCQMPTNTSIVIQKSVNDIGGIEKLVCLVMSPMDLNISWVKVNNVNLNKPVVLTYGNKVVIIDSRLSLQKDIVISELSNGNRHTLTISSLITSDSGSYLCQAMLQSNIIIFTKIELEVHQPTPATIFNNITSFSVALEGKPLKLECQASGSPVPSIYWRREGSGMYHSGNTLEIAATKKEDRGIYYCIAENGIKPSPRRRIDVIIEFPPIVTTSKRLHGQALNYYVDLSCRIKACPIPTIVWMYKGIPVSNNQYYTISTIATSSEEIVDSKLHINIIEKHQYGDYVCKAFNIFGAAEVTINLYETTKPE